jgi:thioredoxin reductase (NADPH)
MEKIRCLIIGSGPAAYTAAIYAARANQKPVIIEGLQPGGQLTTTTEIDNFPGYPEGITGTLMMEDLKKQAERFETEIRYGLITEVDFSKKPFTLKGDPDMEFEADTVIIEKYIPVEKIIYKEQKNWFKNILDKTKFIFLFIFFILLSLIIIKLLQKNKSTR